jgi:hypothetical protein
VQRSHLLAVVVPQCLQHLTLPAQQTVMQIRRAGQKPPAWVRPEGFPTTKAAVNEALASRCLQLGANVADNQWMLLDSWSTSASQQ